MSSEQRLHPLSILFDFLTQIRLFVVPGILLAVGASSRGSDWWQWQPWMMLLIIPNAILAIVRYLTYTYRYGEGELVIRRGLLFQSERHIPYARIQNIDAVQNVLHRLFGVAEVKLETGGGGEAEATMSVLPMSAFVEMRRRVFAGRLDGEAAGAPVEPPSDVLVHLTPRELLLCGFIENRGGVLIAAMLGGLWEFGAVDRLAAPWLGDLPGGRGLIRGLIRSVSGNVDELWNRLGLVVLVLTSLVVIVRLVSMGWAVVRLYGFTVRDVGGDARGEYGLLTHVTMTVPLRRVQTLTVHEGPWHRLAKRVTVRVDTAAGHEGRDEERTSREPIAPLLPTHELGAFVNRVLDVDLTAVEWQPVHPGAFRRMARQAVAIAMLISVAMAIPLRWYALPIAMVLIAWSLVAARQAARHLRWAITDHAVMMRSGWIVRRTVLVPLAKVQAVTERRSPFDRRAGMASVRVDTAGAVGERVVHVPYLGQAVASSLRKQLAAVAGQTVLRW